jgi:hypothetical protein
MSSSHNVKQNGHKPSLNTIDEKHTDMLRQISAVDSDIIPKLNAEKEKLKSYIRTLHTNQISEYLDARDRINEIRTEIRNHKKESKDYMLNNAKYIFDYFEQKQQISNKMEKSQNMSSVNTFFKIKSTNPTSDNEASNKYAKLKRNCQKYWRNVTNDLTNIQEYNIKTDVCDVCNVGELIPQDEEGILICNNRNCGRFVTYIVDSSKPNNKEPPNEVSYTAYIRLNHFKEILSQFQAKETTQIPEEVLDAIRARITKERITDMSLINYDKMRDILRKLGLNKYFEHIQYINSLFGIKPPVMNEELHETLCVLFIEIQKPWAVHCPANRTNFFNYTYTLHQLCVLLDQTQYLPYIPMMKDREKQLEQDMIWKKVCQDLDWEFFPSV